MCNLLIMCILLSDTKHSHSATGNVGLQCQLTEVNSKNV